MGIHVPVYIKMKTIWELFNKECIRKILIFDWTFQCNLTNNIWHLSLRVGHQCLSCCPEREGQQGNMLCKIVYTGTYEIWVDLLYTGTQIPILYKNFTLKCVTIILLFNNIRYNIVMYFVIFWKEKNLLVNIH